MALDGPAPARPDTMPKGLLSKKGGLKVGALLRTPVHSRRLAPLPATPAPDAIHLLAAELMCSVYVRVNCDL